jgi:hypothetical protein
MTSTKVTDAHGALVEDHRRLHGLVKRLREAQEPAELAAVLSELHEALTRHFREEESPGGLYDALGVCVPEFREQLGEMVDDHYRIAAGIRDLRDRVQGPLGGVPDELIGEARRLADHLVWHERREHELVDAAAAAAKG